MASEGVLATLRAGWEALDGIPALKAVIGGLALSAWNHARYTRDADVLVAIPVDQVDRLVAALAAAGFHPRHSPPLRVIETQGIVQFTFQPPGSLMPFQLDVLLAETAFQQDALVRAVPRPLPGDEGEVMVVRPDDLLVIKLLAGRIIDRADAAMVLRENRDSIDFDRLHRVIAEQGLSEDYRATWLEAYPSEPVPDLS